MKANIHPQFFESVISCACGNTFTIGSTVKSMRVDICSSCHPFFTGEQKFIDTLGRVDKFMAKRSAASSYVKKNSKKQSAAGNTKTLSLKDMLTVTKTPAAPK